MKYGECESIKVATADGVNLNVRMWGEGRLTCVLLHGLAEGSFVWRQFAGEMSVDCRVVAVDLRGHGDSQWDPTGSYNLDTYVDDVTRVLEFLEPRDFVLVGHSLGGSVVARILQRRRLRITAAVFVDAGPVPFDLETRKHLREQILESYRVYSSVNEYSKWLQQRRILASSEVIGQLARDSLRTNASGGYLPRFDIGVVDNIVNDNDTSWWWPVLSTLDIPVLIVRGRGSAILPQRFAERMRRSSSKIAMAVVELAGHAVMNDNPEGFTRAMKPFLASLTQFTVMATRARGGR
jgi:pimeloyl-ACP methyl ester carboxylesterase